MKFLYREVYRHWKNIGKHNFWGDPMDFRFFIVKKLELVHSENVLDVGCNAGVILHFLKSKEKVGIDVDINSLKIGKNFYPDIEYIAASGDKLPFKKNIFDLVISIDTFDTIPVEHKKATNEVFQVAKKDGRVIFSGRKYLKKKYLKILAKEITLGTWLENIKEQFDVKIIWYKQPNLYTINSKFRRLLLTKTPDFIFKIIRPDNRLYQSYKQSSNPLHGEPFIVTGTKKIA